jgi:hypothetical protein
MEAMSATSRTLRMRARYARELSDQALKPVLRTRLLSIAAKLDALAGSEERRRTVVEPSSRVAVLQISD